jgi:O-antigen ligase
MRAGPVRSPALVGPLLRSPLPAWVLLFLNVMPFQGTSILPIPHFLGQATAQGSLIVALVLALLANPAMVIRPNIIVLLLTAMAVLALAVSIHNEFPVGSTYRAFRLVLFVAVMWVLTAWWGRAELPLLRAHLTCLTVILASVWLGALVAPGPAFATEGRLAGLVWPIPPPQVGHYAAVLVACTVVLWFCRLVGGRGTAVTLVAGGMALVATHTRTALLGLTLGLVVAGASLFLGHVRVRRTAVLTLLVVLVTWTVFSPYIVAWLARGQSVKDLAQLTGRTKVWALAAERSTTLAQELFGTGLGNKSFEGLAIDSNWVSTHLELGRVGVAIVVTLLLVLFLSAWARPAGPRRAIALLLVVYCVTASFTETGLGDASPYLLDLVVAASLVAGPPGSVRRTPVHGTRGRGLPRSRADGIAAARNALS